MSDMNTKLIEKLEKLLNEEKWTRATINNYTIKNFEELNDLLNEFKINNLYNDIKEITNEYLTHNKNSIVALYISAIIQLEESNIDYNNIHNLLKIFTDNLKWNIVEYLCIKILEYIEDKFVIRTLITAYTNLNKKDKLPDLWEKLIKVDFEEADIVVNLAVLKEEKQEIEDAIQLYKKALNRYIINKNYTKVEELLKKLLSYDSIGYEYFFSLDKKISKTFSIDRSIDLLKILYEETSKKNDYDACLKIIKLILDKSPTDEYCRKEIVKIYRKKYADHSQLEEFIKISNLEGSWRNIHDAIDSFEKHIVFDKNNFVYHRAWGIGKIVDVVKDVFTINFQSKQVHKMTLKMALSSLQILSKNHIWILKLKNKELLKSKVLEDIKWALKTIILSYNNNATMKTFKDELVPDIMSESKWNSWWTEARKILKTDPLFGTSEENENVFQVKDKPISFEEKTLNSFKNAKDFNQRFSLIMDYLENTDPDPDFLEEMLAYFATYLNTLNNVNEQTIICYLLISNVKSKYSFIKHTINYSFKDFFEAIDDPVSIYANLSLSDFKKDFLLNIKKTSKDWVDIFIKIFYQYPNKFIYDELSHKDFSIIEKLIKDLISKYREYDETFFWIVTNALDDKLIEKLSINFDNILFSIIHLVEIATKNIGLKIDMQKNKRLAKQLKDYLTKDDLLLKHIENSDEEFSKRLFAVVNELISLDGEYVIQIKNKISEKFPEIDTDKVLKFDTETKVKFTDRLLTTQASYERMQKEMINLKDVEIPQNSKEIGWAMEKGDLKENAEYKAAKEQQAILQTKLNKLIDDLSKAIILHKSDITGDSITFGTKIKLLDKISNKTVEYTILGPWESKSEENIISYQSPLGANLLDKKVDDTIKFVLNDKEYNYKVMEIKIADFE
jgi:transcription elongation factor GreA